MKSKIILGTTLILAGVISIASQFITIGDNFILSTLTILLLIIYFGLGGNKKYSNIGFIIGACVIPVIQFSDYLELNHILSNFEGTIFLILLTIAFSLVYFLHTLNNKELSSNKRHWPGITSLGLLLLSLLTFIGEYFNLNFNLSHLSWNFSNIILDNLDIVILISIGLKLLLKGISNNCKDKSTISYK